MAHPTIPTIDRLLADVGTSVRRVVFARGVEAWSDGEGGWRRAHDATMNGAPATTVDARSVRHTPAPSPRRDQSTLAAIGLLPIRPAAAPPSPRLAASAADDPFAVGVRHGLAPLLLASGDARGGGGAHETTHIVSSAGTLGWRPPIERLYDDATVGRRALRLRFLLDAVEYHATRAAESYASAAAAARTAAALFDGHELTTLSGQTGLFIELDALLGAVQRTYAAGAQLLAAAFPSRRRREHRERDALPPHAAFDALVLSARSAPPDLRETLLAAWERHGAHAGAYRRLLRARDARDLGHAPVQLARLSPEVWAVSVPVATPAADGLTVSARRQAPRRRVDALERAWAIATDAMRVVSLVVYAVAEDERRAPSAEP